MNIVVYSFFLTFLENIKKMLAMEKKQVYNLKCCVTLIAVKRRLPRRKMLLFSGFFVERMSGNMDYLIH